MAQRVLTSDNEIILSTDSDVSSQSSMTWTVHLPVPGDGTGGTVANGWSVVIGATGAGHLIVRNSLGSILYEIDSHDAVQFSVGVSPGSFGWEVVPVPPNYPSTRIAGTTLTVDQNIDIPDSPLGQGITGTRYTTAIGSGSGFTFRGRAASGTKSTPGPTKAGQVVVNFTGHATPDGVNFFGQCEIILVATQDHDAIHRGTKMTFGVTPNDSAIRQDAWKLAGTDPDMPHLQPNDGFDNLVDLGQPTLRVRSGYFGTKVVAGGNAGAAGLLQINGPSGSARDLIWTTAGVRRWHARANTVAEAGGNAGSDFVLRAYADDGVTPVADVFTITRSTGFVLVGGDLGVIAGKVFRVNNLPVVGARKTGWATWTGTANRATKDTASATLADVAQTLKALIDDLHATAGHGMIGT